MKHSMNIYIFLLLLSAIAPLSISAHMPSGEGALVRATPLLQSTRSLLIEAERAEARNLQDRVLARKPADYAPLLDLLDQIPTCNKARADSAKSEEIERDRTGIECLNQKIEALQTSVKKNFPELDNLVVFPLQKLRLDISSPFFFQRDKNNLIAFSRETDRPIQYFSKYCSSVWGYNSFTRLALATVSPANWYNDDCVNAVVTIVKAIVTSLPTMTSENLLQTLQLDKAAIATEVEDIFTGYKKGAVSASVVLPDIKYSFSGIWTDGIGNGFMNSGGAMVNSRYASGTNYAQYLRGEESLRNPESLRAVLNEQAGNYVRSPDYEPPVRTVVQNDDYGSPLGLAVRSLIIRAFTLGTWP